MSYEYVVVARDYIRDIVLFENEYTDANTAYHQYRLLTDKYSSTETVEVELIEPEPTQH